MPRKPAEKESSTIGERKGTEARETLLSVLGKEDEADLSSQMKVGLLWGLSHTHLCSLTKRSRIIYSCSK